MKQAHVFRSLNRLDARYATNSGRWLAHLICQPNLVVGLMR